MKEQTKFRLTLVSLGVGGLVLLVVSEGKTLPWLQTSVPELIANLLKGLGEAFAIAAILAFVVDQAAKRRLLIHIGPAYRFSIESVECFRDGSIVPFFASSPVLSTTLTVFYPIDRMKVFVDLSFGDIERDTERTPLSNGVQWAFKKPMLPGQGFSTRFVTLPNKGKDGDRHAAG